MMKNIFVGALILLSAICDAQDKDPDVYIPTDKIRVRFYGGAGELDDKQKLVIDPRQVLLSIQFLIKQIQHIEIIDDSHGSERCDSLSIKASPSTLGSYTIDPAQDLRQLDIVIDLPCSAYHKNFNILIHVKSKVGNFSHRQKIMAIIDSGEGI